MRLEMAKRPIYLPNKNGMIEVEEREIDFKWHAGMAKSQKQKSIFSLHQSAKDAGINNLLEISSKSEIEIGVKLSAFNLSIRTKKNNIFSVEVAFQSSKVFERGGPFTDILNKTSREAKKDIRLKESGNLTKFFFFNQEFPLTPRTFFYDWLYINALKQNKELSNKILDYSGFTDIEFNPKKSINCQAFSAAIFVTLSSSNLLNDSLKSPEAFSEILADIYQVKRNNTQIQTSLV